MTDFSGIDERHGESWAPAGKRLVAVALLMFSPFVAYSAYMGLMVLVLALVTVAAGGD